MPDYLPYVLLSCVVLGLLAAYKKFKLDQIPDELEEFEWKKTHPDRLSIDGLSKDVMESETEALKDEWAWEELREEVALGDDMKQAEALREELVKDELQDDAARDAAQKQNA